MEISKSNESEGLDLGKVKDPIGTQWKTNIGGISPHLRLGDALPGIGVIGTARRLGELTTLDRCRLALDIFQTNYGRERHLPSKRLMDELSMCVAVVMQMEDEVETRLLLRHEAKASESADSSNSTDA